VHHRPLAGTNLCILLTEAHACNQLVWDLFPESGVEPATFELPVQRCNGPLHYQDTRSRIPYWSPNISFSYVLQWGATKRKSPVNRSPSRYATVTWCALIFVRYGVNRLNRRRRGVGSFPVHTAAFCHPDQSVMRGNDLKWTTGHLVKLVSWVWTSARQHMNASFIVCAAFPLPAMLHGRLSVFCHSSNQSSVHALALPSHIPQFNQLINRSIS